MPKKTVQMATSCPVIIDTKSVSCRKVESIGRISYKELENLPSDKLLKIKKFDFEQCYFKMVNIPDDMQEKYVSIWEVGLLAFYENPNTQESIKFRWLAERNPENYIKDQEEKSGIKKIQKHDIDYYCNFTQFKSCFGEDNINQPYHAGIRWTEDDKCFYLKIKSDTPLGDDVVDICRIEKFIFSENGR
jgi:hypothetical protein